MEHFADLSLSDMTDNIIDQKLIERATRIHDQTLHDKLHAQGTSPPPQLTSPPPQLVLADQKEIGESDVDSASSSQVERHDNTGPSAILDLFADVENEGDSCANPQDTAVIVPDFDQFKSIEDTIVAITSVEKQSSGAPPLLEQRLQAVSQRKKSVSALLEQFNPSSNPSTSPKIFRKFSRTRVSDPPGATDPVVSDDVALPDETEPSQSLSQLELRSRTASAPGAGALPRGNRFARKERLPHVYYRTAPPADENADAVCTPTAKTADGAANTDGNPPDLPQWKKDLLARRKQKKLGTPGAEAGGAPLVSRFRKRAQTSAAPRVGCVGMETTTVVPPPIAPDTRDVTAPPSAGAAAADVSKPSAGMAARDEDTTETAAAVVETADKSTPDRAVPNGVGATSGDTMEDAFGLWGVSRRPSVAQLAAQHRSSADASAGSLGVGPERHSGYSATRHTRGSVGTANDGTATTVDMGVGVSSHISKSSTSAEENRDVVVPITVDISGKGEDTDEFSF